MLMFGRTSRSAVIAFFTIILCIAAPHSACGQGSPVPPVGVSSGPNDPAGQTDSSKDMAMLKEEVRQLKSLVGALRTQNIAIGNNLAAAPEVELQKEDYAKARLRFHTKLVRKGPSPQPSEPIKPPAGVSEVEYSSGGIHLKAWVNRPADAARQYPAVLFLHGGFGFDLGDWESTKPYRDAGYVVMTPILRAENGQPGSFSYYYDEVNDVLAAAEYLSKLPCVDPKQLFVAGHSVGGTMTLFAAIASTRFRAAAAFSGGPFWPPFIDATDLPFDKTDPREILLRSPISYASSVKCPLRMYYGTEEAPFFGLMNQRFASLAKRHGLNVEAMEIEGNHGSHVRWSMIQSIVFFQKICSQQVTTSNGENAPLPKAAEMDLGDGVKLKLVRIEPGKFRMGSPPDEAGRADDEPQHQVDIAKPCCLGVTEVTQAQFRQVMGMKPSFYSANGDGWDKLPGLNTDDFPVERVSWEDAMDFCRIVSMLPEMRSKGWVADLPTEAEWEYACRAGTETTFYFGNSLSSLQANFNGNNPHGGAAKGPFLNRTTKVGSYPPNAWGLFDMHGNVLEWCKDSYDKNYQPKDKTIVSERVTRGGFWLSGGGRCRAACRQQVGPSTRASGVGFRVVFRTRER